MLRSHVGLFYRSPAKFLFTFQMVNEEGRAVASVDFVDGEYVGHLVTRDMVRRLNAVIRLGRYWMNQADRGNKYPVV